MRQATASGSQRRAHRSVTLLWFPGRLASPGRLRLEDPERPATRRDPRPGCETRSESNTYTRAPGRSPRHKRYGRCGSLRFRRSRSRLFKNTSAHCSRRPRRLQAKRRSGGMRLQYHRSSQRVLPYDSLDATYFVSRGGGAVAGREERDLKRNSRCQHSPCHHRRGCIISGIIRAKRSHRNARALMASFASTYYRSRTRGPTFQRGS